MTKKHYVVIFHDAPKLLHNSKRYQNNPVLAPFVFSTLVTSRHQITEFYYINLKQKPQKLISGHTLLFGNGFRE